MTTLKNSLITPLWAVLIALGTVDAVQATTFYGKGKPLGNGYIRSFVEIDDRGKPSEIGVILTAGVLSLPIGDTEPDIVTQLSLPPEASATAFKNLEFTYRPHGYPGVPEVFNVPRFSLDFFLLSPQKRSLICPHPDTTIPQVPTCVGDELAQASQPPDPGTLPEGLLPDDLVEAGHGRRYYDPKTPFPFTSFSEYGFYAGKLSFMEVVASKTFLETQPNVTIPIPLPTSYSKSGYYPTAYSITYDALRQEYRLSYSGLTYRYPETFPYEGLISAEPLGYRFPGKQQSEKTEIRQLMIKE